MEIFDGTADLARVTAGHRPWQRVLEAIERAPTWYEGSMHSLGDSLTALRTRCRWEAEHFTGHRRYLEVTCAGASPVELEVARKDELVSAGDYRDTSDREHFTGTGRPVRLEPRQILVLATDEALRWRAPADAPATVVHLTVEGTVLRSP
ncbi:hypothetical protein [Brachybacterium sp. YJGR34]|uniref:hypothetical protein n=1 Tax=Brachybacterium sp. YJGR34 TaxID=2059911 RepID=UPI000E0A8803|nr:hypothetical protein [Brachybacterium sp. YJGR34]